MQNFDRKVKYLDSLFIYKFKIYDYECNKLKIYFISADNQHIFLMIDNIPNVDNNYVCEVGDLFFNDEKKMTFEDTPIEMITIGVSEFKLFKKYFDRIPSWTQHKINEIIEVINKKV